MPDRMFNVLFLGPGNSAQSIVAESAHRKRGGDRFRIFSASSYLKGACYPVALSLLTGMGYPIEGLRSKSWNEFAAPGAPVMDFVFTVCDAAAGEVCPLWPGQPLTAHWGIDDPSLVQGNPIERETAFVTALRYLENRIAAFIHLPIAALGSMTLQARLGENGQGEGASIPRQKAA